MGIFDKKEDENKVEGENAASEAGAENTENVDDNAPAEAPAEEPAAEVVAEPSPEAAEEFPEGGKTIWVKKDGSELELNNLPATVKQAKSLGWSVKD